MRASLQGRGDGLSRGCVPRLLPPAPLSAAGRPGSGNVRISVLSAVAQGRTRLNEIVQATGVGQATTVSRYLDVLQKMRLITREVPATEPRPDKSKKGIYRIDDHFLRFWFRYVRPYEGALELGLADAVLDQRVRPTFSTTCAARPRSWSEPLGHMMSLPPCFRAPASRPRLSSGRCARWSSWSKPNKLRIERLIAAGRMTPAGLAPVEAAKADRGDGALGRGRTSAVLRPPRPRRPRPHRFRISTRQWPSSGTTSRTSCPSFAVLSGTFVAPAASSSTASTSSPAIWASTSLVFT